MERDQLNKNKLALREHFKQKLKEVNMIYDDVAVILNVAGRKRVEQYISGYRNLPSEKYERLLKNMDKLAEDEREVSKIFEDEED